MLVILNWICILMGVTQKKHSPVLAAYFFFPIQYLCCWNIVVLVECGKRNFVYQAWRKWPSSLRKINFSRVFDWFCFLLFFFWCLIRPLLFWFGSSYFLCRFFYCLRRLIGHLRERIYLYRVMQRWMNFWWHILSSWTFSKFFNYLTYSWRI